MIPAPFNHHDDFVPSRSKIFSSNAVRRNMVNSIKSTWTYQKHKYCWSHLIHVFSDETWSFILYLLPVLLLFSSKPKTYLFVIILHNLPSPREFEKVIQNTCQRISVDNLHELSSRSSWIDYFKIFVRGSPLSSLMMREIILSDPSKSFNLHDRYLILSF